MKEFKRLDNPQEYRLLFAVDELPFAIQAARLSGVSLKELATEGQEYTTINGIKGTVEPGEVFVSLVPQEPDLASFWQGFDSLRQASNKPST